MDETTTTESEWDITTTAQVERTYRVKGTTSDQAHTRLRSFLKDADAIRPGLVTEVTEKRTDTTPQRVKDVAPVIATAERGSRQLDGATD